jgi:Zn finger protein HypA/HybF involved in hydrogenase expression
MNLKCSKGHSLLYRHTIKIEMESGFDYRGDFLFTNKHTIRRTRGSNPSIKFDPEKNKFFCRHCIRAFSLSETYARCGNCGRLMKQNLVTNIGKSLAVCNTCYKQIISYKAFDIFNLFESSLSKIKEINISNFHSYDWNEVLKLFGGEGLSETPRRSSPPNSEPRVASNITLRATRRNFAVRGESRDIIEDDSDGPPSFERFINTANQSSTEGNIERNID